MLNLLGYIIGVISTVLLRTVLGIFLLSSTYSGFYRKRVNQANIVSIAIECAMVGLGVLAAVSRSVTIALVSIFYIGRLDTPLLAPGVSLGPLKDIHPINFRKDLLIEEAHRHPYLEMMGKLYIMKLSYRKNFIDRVGFCYRLVFTLALMPWLRKHRTMARPKLMQRPSAIDTYLQFRPERQQTVLLARGKF